ncbi:MAG: T9SS type A sorting domain-containing protein, partial [Flavobacteriales bacterium]|nr:T9SS type A sorting domain-containing protein [Flavobacteriales bacterium]
AGSGWDEYLWQDGSTGQTFTTSNTGTFAVTATLGNCEVTDEIVIENFISSFLNLGEDFDMCDNEVVVLDASNFAECVWQDGSQTPTYTVFEGGTYWVTCTLPCFATDTVYVDDCNQTIGLEEISEHGISLYPNPNHGEFSVHWNNSFGEMMHVEILDANGKLVERILLTGLSNSITADVRHLDRAFYTLRLVGTNRISEMKLVLIE